jgi:chromosomal replication initiator protein
MITSADIYWQKCLDIIKDNITSQVFNTWFKPISAIKYENHVLTVKVPSQFFCEWIEEHYYPLLQKTILKIMGDTAKLEYQVVIDDNHESLQQRTMKLPAFRNPPPSNQNQLPFAVSNPVVQDFPSYLNNRYTFNNFINGDSNQLAYSAAMAVADNPGKTRYNPLFIYGGSGLGKTHLAQAIGNYIINKNKNLRLLYTTSERFTVEYINAIQNNKANDFIAFYRSIDVLIIDDIQFFAGKEKTMDNFFHTFNSLHQESKQIILTSDRSLKDLKDIDDRLISRFQWGLVADIQMPDLEMRMAITQKKSADEGLTLPYEIIEYIAKNVSTSIRVIEGTLIKLLASTTLDNRELNLNLVKEIIHGTTSIEAKPLTIDEIKRNVSVYYNISNEIIESKSRKHEIALARQMAIYLTKQLTTLSLKTIGSYFGNRDHTTILHSCQTIENYLVTDKNVKKDFETLFEKLKTYQS